MLLACRAAVPFSLNDLIWLAVLLVTPSLLLVFLLHTLLLPLVLLVGICSGGGAAAEGSVGSVIAGSQAAAFMLN